MNETTNDSVALLRALIRRPSVTPEDGGCQALIGERLAALGFALEPMPADGVTNLWARLGDEAPSSCSPGTPTSCRSGTSRPGARRRSPPTSSTATSSGAGRRT